MSSRTIQVTPAIDDYIHAVSLREPDVLRAPARGDREASNARACRSRPEQGQFMALLVRLIGAQADARGRHLHRLQRARVALAPARGRPARRLRRERGMDRDRRGATGSEAGVAGKIELRLAPALDTLPRCSRPRGARSTSPSSTPTRRTTTPTTSVRCSCVRPGGLIADRQRAVERRRRRSQTRRSRHARDRCAEPQAACRCSASISACCRWATD